MVQVGQGISREDAAQARRNRDSRFHGGLCDVVVDNVAWEYRCRFVDYTFIVIQVRASNGFVHFAQNGVMASVRRCAFHIVHLDDLALADDDARYDGALDGFAISNKLALGVVVVSLGGRGGEVNARTETLEVGAHLGTHKVRLHDAAEEARLVVA